MFESHIHLTLYPEYVEPVSLVFGFGEFGMKVLFLSYKYRTYSGTIDNVMGIIMKIWKVRISPTLGVKPTHLPFFSVGAGEELVSE